MDCRHAEEIEAQSVRPHDQERVHSSVNHHKSPPTGTILVSTPTSAAWSLIGRCRPGRPAMQAPNITRRRSLWSVGRSNISVYSFVITVSSCRPRIGQSTSLPMSSKHCSTGTSALQSESDLVRPAPDGRQRSAPAAPRPAHPRNCTDHVQPDHDR